MSTKIEKADSFKNLFKMSHLTVALGAVTISIPKLRVFSLFRYFSQEFLFNFNIAISI